MTDTTKQTALTTGITAVAVQSKHWWMSKTIWFNALSLIAATTAYAKDLHFVHQYAEQLALGGFVVNMLLRCITKSALSFDQEATQTVTVDPDTAVEVSKEPM